MSQKIIHYHTVGLITHIMSQHCVICIHAESHDLRVTRVSDNKVAWLRKVNGALTNTQLGQQRRHWTWSFSHHYQYLEWQSIACLCGTSLNFSPSSPSWLFGSMANPGIFLPEKSQRDSWYPSSPCAQNVLGLLMQAPTPKPKPFSHPLQTQ